MSFLADASAADEEDETNDKILARVAKSECSTVFIWPLANICVCLSIDLWISK